MNGLEKLPECHVFHIEPMLAGVGARHCMLEGRLEEDGGGELAFCLPVESRTSWPEPADVGARGFATLRPEDSAPVIEWATTPREAAAAFGRALRRLGWARSIHAQFVYGESS